MSADRVAEGPGKMTPEQSADAFLASTGGGRGRSPPALPAARSSARRSRPCSTSGSSRTEIKDIQSGYKDPDRFDKWISVLQERVSYEEPIVLPAARA